VSIFGKYHTRKTDINPSSSPERTNDTCRQVRRTSISPNADGPRDAVWMLAAYCKLTPYLNSVQNVHQLQQHTIEMRFSIVNINELLQQINSYRQQNSLSAWQYWSTLECIAFQHCASYMIIHWHISLVHFLWFYIIILALSLFHLEK